MHKLSSDRRHNTRQCCLLRSKLESECDYVFWNFCSALVFKCVWCRMIPVMVKYSCSSLSSGFVVVITPVSGSMLKPSSKMPPYVTSPLAPEDDAT